MKSFGFSTIVLLLISNGTLAIATHDKLIDRIGIQGGGTSDEIVITNKSGWGAEGCASAKHVVLGSSVNNRQAMLSLILSAKMAGKGIRFFGTCDPGNKDKFNATYTRLED